jgi:Domain of unknown function (DUF1905)
MPAERKPVQQIDTSFTAVLRLTPGEGGWIYVVMPGSAEFFETRRPVKVAGTIDGHQFQATFLPWGDGTRILPIRAAVRKLIDKELGAEVTIHLAERLS